MPQLVTANFAVTLADLVALSAVDLLSCDTSTARTSRQSLVREISQEVILCKAPQIEQIVPPRRSRRRPAFPRQSTTPDPILLRDHTSCLFYSSPTSDRNARAMLGAQVAIQHLNQEATSRGARMLRTALGPAIALFLEDPEIVEVMLNPDGRLWIDRLAGGLVDTGEHLSASDGERIVRLVAHHVGAEVHPGSPRVSAELPETGERFEGLLPPVVAAPVFAIRKPAVAVFTLDNYVAAGIMRAGQAETLRTAVADRRNILVAGGTSTGKTTLTNALLAEVAKTTDRVVLIEDTRELQCKAPNLVALRTKDGVASLSDLVRSSLRLRPDRIPIGEVRGAEALDLLKAWGTGHPGGVGTIHAGSALGALRRMEQLIQEAVVTVPRALIAETIQFIAVLAGRGSNRRLAELARVEGLGPNSDYLIHPAGDQP
jgi:type IV secretion system protein TrbB